MDKTQNKEKAQKLTYEQLEKVAGELVSRNKELEIALQRMHMSNQFKRLDYLFEVLKAEAVIKDPDFINSCVDEIKAALTIPSVDSKEGQEDGEK